jgi:hypothetical protein
MVSTILVHEICWIFVHVIGEDRISLMHIAMGIENLLVTKL